MSAPSPRLETERLILRPFTLDDAPRLQVLVSDRAIAETTSAIPYPYPENGAIEWVRSQLEPGVSESFATFAVTLRSTGELIGSFGLRIKAEHQRAEMGYWIGVSFWGQGYATEAAKAVIGYAFSRGLNRVFAEHYRTNPASGRVLQKAGMTHEGTLRQHMIKWGEPMDMEVYSILRGEWKP